MKKTFENFMVYVDKEIFRHYGTNSENLPDARWYDYFKDGQTAAQAVRNAREDSWINV
jgi:hypothetical protein